jgi:hypothetical protein
VGWVRKAAETAKEFLMSRIMDIRDKDGNIIGSIDDAPYQRAEARRQAQEEREQFRREEAKREWERETEREKERREQANKIRKERGWEHDNFSDDAVLNTYYHEQKVTMLKTKYGQKFSEKELFTKAYHDAITVLRRELLIKILSLFLTIAIPIVASVLVGPLPALNGFSILIGCIAFIVSGVKVGRDCFEERYGGIQILYGLAGLVAGILLASIPSGILGQTTGTYILFCAIASFVFSWRLKDLCDFFGQLEGVYTHGFIDILKNLYSLWRIGDGHMRYLKRQSIPLSWLGNNIPDIEAKRIREERGWGYELSDEEVLARDNYDLKVADLKTKYGKKFSEKELFTKAYHDAIAVHRRKLLIKTFFLFLTIAIPVLAIIVVAFFAEPLPTLDVLLLLIGCIFFIILGVRIGDDDLLLESFLLALCGLAGLVVGGILWVISIAISVLILPTNTDKSVEISSITVFFLAIAGFVFRKIVNYYYTRGEYDVTRGNYYISYYGKYSYTERHYKNSDGYASRERLIAEENIDLLKRVSNMPSWQTYSLNN